MPRLLIPAAVLVSLLLGSRSLPADAPVDYLREVKPLFAARCYACHGALQQKGDLRLDTAGLLRKGGISGSASDVLLAHVTGSDGKPRMPPASEGEPLTAKQIATLRAWIEQGAKGPDDEKPETDPKDHWAFRKPTRPATPVLKDAARVRNPLDAFLGSVREQNKVSLAAPAERRVLLRRLYLDLVGVPPTLDELTAFATSTNPDEEYARSVDKLLATPQYGERWGRHFMDVWRYSDWWGLGAEVRNSQKHIWHWRDWIVEALNDDKGYDQMIREMLAADELYPNDLDKLRASGFLARQYFKFNRNSWLDETVEHTAKAFLGLTFNCARCHDHKYDPVSQVDYFRFRAFFEPYQIRTDMVPGQPDFEKDGIPRAFDCNLTAPTYRFVRGDEKRPVTDKPLTPGVPSLLSLGDLGIRPVTLPPEAHSPGLRPFVLGEQVRAAEAVVQTALAAIEQARKTLAETEKRPVPTPPEPVQPVAGKVLFRDDFAGPKPELWETGPGMWKHEGGKLLQQADKDERVWLRAKQQPPADFVAKFTFAITGGTPYRSVGVTFDVAGENEVLVYASAHAPGQKVQIAYKQGAAHVYPAGALQTRAIKLGEQLEMTIRVRGTLVNVAINGDHAIAYRLPIARKAGDLRLITFTATAEFRAFELATLPADAVLIDAGGTAPVVNKPLTVEQARAALVVAEKALAAAEAVPASLQARAAAQRAPETKDLARKAALAERAVNVAKADEALARAELEVLQAIPAKKAEAEKKRTAARAALAAARKALDAPGETFTPLRGALKTVESTTESEANRNRPFPTTSTGRRTALAQWLTDRRHPLTARVLVNHVWTRHFGKPLVPTLFDLGRKGTPPTHPELLDWLAVEFMESGWSLKHLHRLMVLSETYRLTSSSAGHAGDPENRYYGRMNSTRMDAQVLRDSLLSLAGELDPKLGGPSIPVNAETRRRSLYYVHSHNDQQKFLAIFDDSSVLECYRRAESIVPQQALALANSKFALTMAEKINARLAAVPDADFVRAAFETILATTPTDAERKECEAALVELRTLLKGAHDAAKRARGDLIQALLNHNDFIAVR